MSSQPRAGDVRALLGAVTLGSGMGLAIGAAYLLGGLDRTPGARAVPAAAPAMEASAPASGPPGGGPVPSKPASARAPGKFAAAVGALRARFQIAAASPVAARPYRFAASVDEAGLNCLTQAVYFEARGESQAGQKAVAQVVLNRVRHPAFPKTICGVVRQRSAAGCQFTFACKDLAKEPLDDDAWRRARRVASDALHGAVMAGVGEATHFQTARSGPFGGLLKVAQIGAHVFYRFAGRAGSDSMFRQVPASSQAAELRTAAQAPAGRVVMASLLPMAAQAAPASAAPAPAPAERAPAPAAVDKPVAPAASAAAPAADKAG